MGPTPDNMNSINNNTELSSHEGTRSEFNPSKAVIKLGIDVHQEHYVVVVQEGGGNPKPAQRFGKAALLSWAARLKQKSGAEIHACDVTRRCSERLPALCSRFPMIKTLPLRLALAPGSRR